MFFRKAVKIEDLEKEIAAMRVGVVSCETKLRKIMRRTDEYTGDILIRGSELDELMFYVCNIKGDRNELGR